MPFGFKKSIENSTCRKQAAACRSATNELHCRARHRRPERGRRCISAGISVLYAVAYTLKMSYKTDYKIAGFFEYVVPPLEGFWRQDDVDGVNYADKSGFHWISVIRLPDFVTKTDLTGPYRRQQKETAGLLLSRVFDD